MNKEEMSYYVHEMHWHLPEETQQNAIDYLIDNAPLNELGQLFSLSNKPHWQNCMKIVTAIGYPYNIAAFPKMVELFQDINWPGANEAVDYFRTLVKQELPQFESYFDAVEEILAESDLVIDYKPSGRTVTTQIGRKCFQAEVPAFTVEIRHEDDLNEAFEEWFRYAFDNNLWALTQSKSVTYEDGFPRMTLQQNEILLVAEHDAYGFTVVTNRAELQQEDNVRKLLENTLNK